MQRMRPLSGFGGSVGDVARGVNLSLQVSQQPTDNPRLVLSSVSRCHSDNSGRIIRLRKIVGTTGCVCYRFESIGNPAVAEYDGSRIRNGSRCVARQLCNCLLDNVSTY